MFVRSVNYFFTEFTYFLVNIRDINIWFVRVNGVIPGINIFYQYYDSDIFFQPLEHSLINYFNR